MLLLLALACSSVDSFTASYDNIYCAAVRECGEEWGLSASEARGDCDGVALKHGCMSDEQTLVCDYSAVDARSCLQGMREADCDDEGLVDARNSASCAVAVACRCE